MPKLTQTKLTRRQILAAGAGAGVMMSLPGSALRASSRISPIETVNVGMISCGGRAMALAEKFSKVDGVNIAGLCDPDSNRVGQAKEIYPKAQTWNDLRDMIKSDSIDAVVVATCNHWHCLAAIWAMEAGKHVYVEKPLSHTQWEGQQCVAAARSTTRFAKLVRSSVRIQCRRRSKSSLHEEKALGDIQVARINRFGRRPSIGKLDKPLVIDKGVDYDLWLGPAQDKPIFRDKTTVRLALGFQHGFWGNGQLGRAYFGRRSQ